MRCPRIGVSACLLGQAVRFDAGHRRDSFLCQELSPWVEFVPVCPEVEMGLGVPRPTLRLIRTDGGVRLVTGASGGDHSERLREFAVRRIAQLRQLGLCGFVLKSQSPTCGLERVRVYSPQGQVVGRDRGRFAAALLESWPELPVEEEGRLRDPVLREHFLERVFALWSWQMFAAGQPGRRELVRFHTEEKLRLLAHDPARAAHLGRVVAQNARGALETYGVLYLQALSRPVSRARHLNVLQHAAGMLRRVLRPAERQEVNEVLEGYRRGWLPLVVPVRLLRALARTYDHAWLRAQRYWSPYPDELGLRNAL